MYISPTRIWTFDYQNRADSTEITPSFRNFPDPACGSLRRTGNALILGLAKDIHGIGFQSADTIAQKLGIARDSIMRALAGIMHALLQATGEGHCALPKEELIEQA